MRKTNHSLIVYRSSLTINNFPLNSLTSDSSMDNAATNFSFFGGCMTNTIIPEYSFGSKRDVFKKSASRDKKTAFRSFAKAAALPFDIPFGGLSAENPRLSRRRMTEFGIFSSSTNLGKFDITLPADGFGRIFKGFFDHRLCQARVFLDEIACSFTSCYEFDYIADEYARALESGLTVTDLAVCDDMPADFDSHNNTYQEEILKMLISSSGRADIQFRARSCSCISTNNEVIGLENIKTRNLQDYQLRLPAFHPNVCNGHGFCTSFCPKSESASFDQNRELHNPIQPDDYLTLGGGLI